MGNTTVTTSHESKDRSRTTRLLGVTVGLVLLIVGAFGAWSLSSLHDSRNWPFSPAGTPDSLHFGDRTYERGDANDDLNEGYVKVEHTEGDGVIYGEPGDGSSVPTSLQVKSDGVIYGYGLIGGP